MRPCRSGIGCACRHQRQREAGHLDLGPKAEIERKGDIVNYGTWRLNGEDVNGAGLRIDPAVDLQGVGEIIASTAPANWIAGEGVLRNRGHTISGVLRLEVTLINDVDGMLIANVDKDGAVFRLASDEVVHNGVALATGAGTMVVQSHVLGDGVWLAENGGAMRFNRARVDPCARLGVSDGSHLDLNQSSVRAMNLLVDETSTVRAVGATGAFGGPSIFRITDSLVVEATGDDSELSWDVDDFPETEFWFYGSQAADGCKASDLPGLPYIELAGFDGGDFSQFYQTNFEMPRSVVGPGAHLQLADFTDNGNRGGTYGPDEALYATTLVFSDEYATITLNGLHLYYKNLIGDPSQILGDPDPCGDPTEDGMITATDALATLKAAVGSLACLPCVCDIDDSGSTTASDALRPLQRAVGQEVELSGIPC